MKINLIEYFENTVDRFPEKIAISDNSMKYNFQELCMRSQVIAHHIDKRNSSINKPIAVFLPKSCDTVASFIATLYSGNCYAPLDVKNPVNRLSSILNVLKPVCIITKTEYLRVIEECESNASIINLDDIAAKSSKIDVAGYKRCIDTDPAYIIHTSGSTGVPKGVVISHRSIFDYIHWAIGTYAVTEKEIIGNQAPFIFDNSTLDIYLMMFTGATLNLIPEQLFMFPAKLLEYVNNCNINFIFWVPSVLINIANLRVLDYLKIPQLAKVLFAGEVMPTKHLNYWIMSLNDDVLFSNLYGPTEITVDCTYYIVDRKFKDDDILPIGKPCRNSDILILNDRNDRCKTDEYGELCVRGSSLSMGYWNNLEKTEAVFAQNPLNKSYPEKIYRTGDIVFTNKHGEIIFVGRKDFQIKHLGYRIELGEIEHTILSCFNAINACVLYDTSESAIILVYEAQNEIPIKDFRMKLNKVLSKYMIPTKI